MDALLALLAVAGLAVFLILKARVPAGVAPLVATACVMLWLFAAALANLLWAGTLLAYLLCGGLCVFALVYRRPAGWRGQLLNPGTVFFVLASVFMLVYLGVRQPVVSDWDELSLWATCVKLLKINNHLYTTAEIGWAWPATQIPGLPLLGYFFQFFGSYAEWKIYLGYDMLLFGVIAALMGSLRFKDYKLAVPLGVAGLLTPWFFTVYTRVIYVENTWITSYGDIPAGMLYGGAVLVYLVLRGKGAKLWPVVPVLMAAALIKENNFVLALAAAGIIAADYLLFAPKRQEALAGGPARRATAPGWRGRARALLTAPLLRRLLVALLLVALTFVPYRAWSMHITPILVGRAEAGAVSVTSDDPIAMIPVALSMLLGGTQPTAQFANALRDLVDAFLHTGITMLPVVKVGGFAIGSGPLVMALVVVLFLVAALCAKQKGLRRRALVAMLLVLLCFVGYYFTLLVSYGFIFKPWQAAALESYNRYVYPAYIGSFLIALGFLAQSARQKDQRFYGLAGGVALALCAGMLLRTTSLLQPQYTVLGYPDSFYAEAKESKRAAALVAKTIENDTQPAVSDRVFLVSQGENGSRWFTYSYELLPLVLDYSGTSSDAGGAGGGGGTFGPPVQEGEETSLYYHPYTPEEIDEYLQESGCGYVFVDNLDELFVDTYSGLFADGLAAAINGETLLYRVEYPLPGQLVLAPVEMEVAA